MSYVGTLFMYESFDISPESAREGWKIIAGAMGFFALATLVGVVYEAVKKDYQSALFIGSFTLGFSIISSGIFCLVRSVEKKEGYEQIV